MYQFSALVYLFPHKQPWLIGIDKEECDKKKIVRQVLIWENAYCIHSE